MSKMVVLTSKFLFITLMSEAVIVVCNGFLSLPNGASSKIIKKFGGIHQAPLSAKSTEACIDFQSDESQYGRGDLHLSAAVDEGDVVVYQTGTWLVDGVEVGDGSPADWKLARLENIQVVWTHNCEHGVLRGIAVELDDDSKTLRYAGSGNEEQVEFGPEQLVARLPVLWDDASNQGTSEIVLDPTWWRKDISGYE